MKTFVQAILLFATVAVARAQGTYEGLTSFSSSASSGFVSGTAGWSFTPHISITVTHLGCLDYVVTPQGPVDIGLWTSAGQLLASAVVDATNNLVDASRYVLLASSVILNSGSAYRLGIWSANGLFLDPVGAGFGGSATVSPDIALGGSAVSAASAFGFPETSGSPGTMLLGPNFRYDRVPEPATAALLGLGSLLLVRRRRVLR